MKSTIILLGITLLILTVNAVGELEIIEFKGLLWIVKNGRVDKIFSIHLFKKRV